MDPLDTSLAALPTMSTAQLRSEWQRIHGEPAPAAFSMDLLARALAWTLQERAHGGLSAGAARKLGEASQQIARRGHASPATPTLRPGSRLVRDWGGRTHHILVVDGGYQYCDRSYRSLTAIARQITGAAWSGPRFFGLTSLRHAGEVRDAAA